jgi:hypothetical protein
MTMRFHRWPETVIARAAWAAPCAGSHGAIEHRARSRCKPRGYWRKNAMACCDRQEVLWKNDRVDHRSAPCGALASTQPNYCAIPLRAWKAPA